MPWFSLGKKKAKDSHWSRSDLDENFEDEEVAGTSIEATENTKKLAIANSKLKGSAQHTDAWLKELNQQIPKDFRKPMQLFSAFRGKTLNGYHCVQFAGGDRYAGQFQDNQFHGQGVHVFPDGEFYDGDWHSGMQHGIGRKYWPNGTKYKGFYREDTRSGLGVCIYPDGTRYCGMWINNLYDGVGKLDWPDKSTHPGSFAVTAGQGLVENPVIVHGKNFVGHFKNGKKTGMGRHVFYDGSSYEGEYVDGNYHGSGKFCFANGDIYEGEWSEGAFHGHGAFWCTKSKKGDDKSLVEDGSAREGYVGDFERGMRHGSGTMYFRNGGKFQGDFKEGARQGVGIHVYPDGRRVKGEWWQYREARDQLPSKIRECGVDVEEFLQDTLLLAHTMSEEGMFKRLFNQELPKLENTKGGQATDDELRLAREQLKEFESTPEGQAQVLLVKAGILTRIYQKFTKTESPASDTKVESDKSSDTKQQHSVLDVYKEVYGGLHSASLKDVHLPAAGR